MARHFRGYSSMKESIRKACLRGFRPYRSNRTKHGLASTAGDADKIRSLTTSAPVWLLPALLWPCLSPAPVHPLMIPTSRHPTATPDTTIAVSTIPAQGGMVNGGGRGAPARHAGSVAWCPGSHAVAQSPRRGGVQTPAAPSWIFSMHCRRRVGLRRFPLDAISKNPLSRVSPKPPVSTGNFCSGLQAASA